MGAVTAREGSERDHRWDQKHMADPLITPELVVVTEFGKNCLGLTPRRPEGWDQMWGSAVAARGIWV